MSNQSYLKIAGVAPDNTARGFSVSEDGFTNVKSDALLSIRGSIAEPYSETFKGAVATFGNEIKAMTTEIMKPQTGQSGLYVYNSRTVKVVGDYVYMCSNTELMKFTKKLNLVYRVSGGSSANSDAVFGSFTVNADGSVIAVQRNGKLFKVDANGVPDSNFNNIAYTSFQTITGTSNGNESGTYLFTHGDNVIGIFKDGIKSFKSNNMTTIVWSKLFADIDGISISTNFVTASEDADFIYILVLPTTNIDAVATSVIRIQKSNGTHVIVKMKIISDGGYNVEAVMLPPIGGVARIYSKRSGDTTVKTAAFVYVVNFAQGTSEVFPTKLDVKPGMAVRPVFRSGKTAHDGSFIIGVSRGVIKFDDNLEAMFIFDVNPENGLSQSNAHSVDVDNAGNVYVATDAALYCISDKLVISGYKLVGANWV